MKKILIILTFCSTISFSQTRLIRAFQVATDYTNAQEATLATTLIGSPAYSVVIYNTDLDKSRYWNGATFSDTPPINATALPTATTTTGGFVPATGTQIGKFLKDDLTWSHENTSNDLLAYTALGSPILSETVNQPLAFSNTSTALVDGQVKYEAVYLPKSATITGAKLYVRVLGSYTADNNNRVGLYTYLNGTITLVASSANNAALWTSAANAVQTIPFSSTYVASPGIYFVAFLYNNSAQVTAPALASGVALNNLVMGSTVYGFTNSAKLHGTSNAADLPSSIAMSSITSSIIPSWVAIY